MENLFDSRQASLKEEIYNELLHFKNIRFEKIISMGQKSKSWYDQEEAEWVCVISGNACLLYEDGNEIHLNAGDWTFIPPHKKHKVIDTSCPCIWLCAFIG